MRKTILFLIVLMAASATQAQTKRRLQFTIAGTAKDTIYLASYYGNKLYYADTAVANAKGVTVFDRPSGYVTGVYAVVIPGPKYFELIVNEPVVEMESDTVSLNEHLVVKKSAENKLFQDYVHYLNDKKMDADKVTALLDSTMDPIAKSNYRKQLSGLETDIKNYQKDLVKNYPSTYVAAIVRMSVAPEETEVRRPDGTLDSSATYYNYRAHFWDNTDLKDPRNLHTPVFQNRFDEYVGKVIPQIPDTINKCVDDLIRRMDDNGDLFKFAVNAITYKYENSDIMGMDAVFVHMAQTYYCPQDGSKSRVTWMPADKMDQLCERAKKMAPLVLGATGSDIILPDTTEKNWVDYYKLPSKYVLLVFWDPHCGHCKKTLPPLYEDYKEKLRPLGVEVFAVAKATDSVLFNDWKAFIRDNHLDWVNVGLTWHVYDEAKKASYKFIPEFTTIESLNYADTWDVYSTPKFFLLDADHKIVGKQLDVDQMVDLIHVLDKRKPIASPVQPRETLDGTVTVPLQEEAGVYYMQIMVNGQLLKNVIFDSGASDISLSATEALFLIKQGYLTDDDFLESSSYQTADGSIISGSMVNLRSLRIGSTELKNVKAVIVNNLSAPILLGQGALRMFSQVTVDNKAKLLILKP